jgi:predicted ATPase/class 3 adenylate cyclase
MRTIPSGTVTLLFSDIEGSTQLLSRLGHTYADVLGAHQRILRSAWTAHRGTEVGTEGDSFFVAFETAPDSVSAAIEAQRGLAAFSWPDGEQVRVRMGIHTGTPTVLDGDYLGMDVHRCARMAGAAHGGQIVVSDATAQLSRSDLADDVSVRDLGLYQLKDLPELERLHQIQAEGLQSVFPPLKSLGAVSRLPVPATPLVGRAAELTELTELLERGGARLVTLTGPGGSGKTRLSLELARGAVADFSGGIHFVPLAEAHTPEQMWDAIAETLAVPSGSTHVLARLRNLQALLVLDNLEQLVGADEVAAQILLEAGEVSLVATSRRPLLLPEEHEYPVSPLGMPSDDTLAAAQASPAVQLFVQQGRRVRPSFSLNEDNAADVVAVCRGLDGLPLALEIAGARVKVLTPRALVTRLGTGLDLSTPVRDVPDRHRTIRAAISWSYELLPAELRTAFACLGVFDGGADLPAVAAVLDDGAGSTGSDPLDLVIGLVDASLVSMTESHDGEPRVGVLETIRAFAADRLALTGDLDTVRGRHARHYRQVLEALGPGLRQGRFWQAREALDAEQGNLRAALRWCLEAAPGGDDQQERTTLALRLCAQLRDYWEAGSKYGEARQWLEAVLAEAGHSASVDRGASLALLAKCLGIQGDSDLAQTRAQEAVEVFRELGDTAPGRADAVLVLASVMWFRGESAAARPLFEQAVEVARLSEDHVYHFVDSLANFEGSEGHHELAIALHEEAVALAQAAGDLTKARIYRHNRACALRNVGRVEEAHDEMRAQIADVVRDGIPGEIVIVAEDFGAVLAELGGHRDAVQLLGAADALRERNGYPREPWQEAEVREAYADCEESLSRREWDESYAAGRSSAVSALLEAQAAASRGQRT